MKHTRARINRNAKLMHELFKVSNTVFNIIINIMLSAAKQV